MVYADINISMYCQNVGVVKDEAGEGGRANLQKTVNEILANADSICYRGTTEGSARK